MTNPKPWSEIARWFKSAEKKAHVCKLAMTDTDVLDEIMLDADANLKRVCRRLGLDYVDVSEVSAKHEYDGELPRLMADQLAIGDVWEATGLPHGKLVTDRLNDPLIWLAFANDQKRADKRG